MNKSESIVEIAKSLAKFRKSVKQPLKDADNPFFSSKYVPLENVVEAIDKALPDGVSYVQWPTNSEDGRVGVSTMILHESGEFMEFEPVFMKPEKQTPQGAGSTITYLKRYALSAVFGITSDQDDDANEGSGNNSKQQNGSPKKASDAQLNKISVLLNQNAKAHGKSKDEIYSGMKEKMKKDMEHFTSSEASQAIKLLEAWKNKQKQGA